VAARKTILEALAEAVNLSNLSEKTNSWHALIDKFHQN
jgi:hypothetical protein